MNNYLKYLLAEILTIVFVTLTFIFISPPLVAGRIAGMFFIAVGMYICSRGVSTPLFRRTYTFALACVHLLLSLVMILTRFAHPDGSFANVHILGMPGPIYHKVATTVYVLLIAATCLDFFIARNKLNKLKPESGR
jgi:hypothetical protein